MQCKLSTVSQQPCCGAASRPTHSLQCRASAGPAASRSQGSKCAQSRYSFWKIYFIPRSRMEMSAGGLESWTVMRDRCLGCVGTCFLQRHLEATGRLASICDGKPCSTCFQQQNAVSSYRNAAKCWQGRSQLFKVACTVIMPMLCRSDALVDFGLGLH